MVQEAINKALAEGDFYTVVSLLEPAIRRMGMSKVARKMGVRREAIYRLVTTTRYPKFQTVWKLMDALGYRLIVESKR